MIRVISFSYKGEVPAADLVYDCRKLRNPYSDPCLRMLTGKYRRVQDFVMEDRKAVALLEHVKTVVKDGMTVAFGCYGGRHRSVALAELLTRYLRNQQFEVEVIHRGL